LYLAAPLLTLISAGIASTIAPRTAISLIILILSHTLHSLVLHLRTPSPTAWAGASEPGVNGDILVLLSYDRWARIQGPVDDLKAVLSGGWLRQPTLLERFLSGLGSMLVYVAVIVLASSDTTPAFKHSAWSSRVSKGPFDRVHAESIGQIILLVLLPVEGALVGLANALADTLQMRGRTVRVTEKPRQYARRKDLAEELIEVHGRADWAVGLGMVGREYLKNDEDVVAPAVM
jgi:hypothetical protein